jgi:uncharacterized lipoprotein YddW (UPF0748 family)
MLAFFTGSCNRPDVPVKEKLVWIEASANFQRFSNKENIMQVLDTIKNTGFNKIVVDVRPITGYALYRSDILPHLTDVGNVPVTYDWDYLQFFIDEAHKRDLKVTVSMAILPAGNTKKREGVAYTDPFFDGKTCVQYTRSGAMLDSKDDPSKFYAYLNPALPEVREYCLSFIKEVVTKYDFDGLALDYCRFEGVESDFSTATRLAFETYLGTTLSKWPDDVFTWNNGNMQAGKYYKQWWAFRAKLISDFVKSVRTEIKSIKPHVMLEYWAASWIHALYPKGQNWASQSFDFTKDYSEWASPEYNQAGFAEYLDIFQLGAYLNDIYGMDNNESIEYAIHRGKKVINNACAMYGTIFTQNHKTNIEEAVYLCLSQTDGLMVFDISQVIDLNLWPAIKKGIDRAEHE